jgi:hypothetical protein
MSERSSEKTRWAEQEAYNLIKSAIEAAYHQKSLPFAIRGRPEDFSHLVAALALMAAGGFLRAGSALSRGGDQLKPALAVLDSIKTMMEEHNPPDLRIVEP